MVMCLHALEVHAPRPLYKHLWGRGGRCGLDVGGQEGEGSLEESAPEWGLQGWVEVGEAEPCRVGREGGYLGQREWMM